MLLEEFDRVLIGLELSKRVAAAVATSVIGLDPYIGQASRARIAQRILDLPADSINHGSCQKSIGVPALRTSWALMLPGTSSNLMV